MPLRFENDFLKKLEYLHVVSKRALAGQNRADRLSPKRGRGLEFADHRPYAAGDDYRHIDWKAYQRLDVSRSMAEPAKFDMARRIAAALCYVGLAHLDRLTIIPFGKDLLRESSPGRGKGRIFRVFEALEQLEAAGPTDLRAACKAFASRPRQNGLVVVISDFLEPDPASKDAAGPQAGLKILRTIGHDVFAVHVTSERDRDPGVLGTVRFVDVETGEIREIEVTPRLAAAYVKAAETHAEALEHFCGRYDIGYVRADSERPFEDVILRTFRQGRFLA
jgi:uncharacterized protein (DUF58 family)